uniref:uncharacterized protein LOC113475382 n=1 Tax=Ciona intestinalis TaxID=7719 RepID=UPI000EF4517E|nr:uncharacterized protein LOC113475382 [Ciona intestinalis]|eukprot:XP_026695280.1 uncharacterized protein LOC113475382 [Ciona intestinalis]
MVAKELLYDGTDSKSVDIYSDSQAGIKALSNLRINSLLVRDTWHALQQLATGNHVRLHWIPGHSDHLGNELADKLARDGSSNIFYGPEPGLPIPTSRCKSDLALWVLAKHQEEWTKHDGCRQTKEYRRNISRCFSEQLLKLLRQTLRSILQVITGHGMFASHLHKLKKSESPICPVCGEEDETSFHYVGICPAYANARREHLNLTELSREDLPSITIKALVAYLRGSARLLKLGRSMQ